MMDPIEVGDLAPIRDVLAWARERLDEEKVRRAEDDPGVLALREIVRRLDDAMAEAAHADLELTVEQFAEVAGVSKWALYKRIKAGTLPARRRGGSIRIPLSSAAA